MDSLTRHLAIFLNIHLIFAKSFKLDVFFDLLKQEMLLSTEEMDKIKSFTMTKSKQNFIKVMQARNVSDNFMCEKFVECLRKSNLSREFDNNVHEKYCELHQAIAYIVQRKSPTKAKGHFGSTSGSITVSPQQSLSAAFTGVHTEDSFGPILNRYLEYLRSTYSKLPAVSLQGWLDSETHTKNYTNITIVKSSQKAGQGYLYNISSSAEAANKHEIEYSAHRCKSDDEIFTFDDSKGKLLILIEGNAGTGKTTYSYNICKRWLSNNVLAEYCFVILVRLRDQRLGDITNPKDLFATMGDIAGSLYTELQAIHYTRNVLFWLEGWDELHDSYKVRSIFTQLLTGELFPNAAVVVSTRSSATASLSHHNFVRRFKLVGFNKQQVELCARGYFTNYYPHQNDFELAYAKFMAQLRSIHGLSQLAEVPLNLSFLLELFVDDNNLPNNLTEIYEKIVLMILQHHKNKHYNRYALTSLTDDDQMPADMNTILHGLGEHAYANVSTQRPFSNEELLVYISDRSLLSQQEFDGMGLLQTIRKRIFTAEKNYYIYHYGIIQEFLSAVYLTGLEADEQKQALITIFGEASYEMVWIFHAGFTRMTRVHIQSILPVLNIAPLPDVKLPLQNCTELVENWGRCYKHYIEMAKNPTFNDGFLLTLMQCCYEAKNPSACKTIANHYYPNNLCRIEIPANRITPYMLLAVSYFIAHSGKMWSVRCVAAISTGVELLNTYINNPALYASSNETIGGLWVWCFVVKPSDINTFINTIEVQPSLQWIHLLNGSRLGNDGTSKLCECLKFDGKVVILELKNCSIGRDGLQTIADMLKINHKILFIDLRQNPFQSEDVKNFLLSIKDKTILEYLLVDKQHVKNADVIEILDEINVSRKSNETTFLRIDDRASFDWTVT